MGYSEYASKATSIKDTFSTFIDKMNATEFSSEWTGTAATSVTEKFKTCCTNAAQQIENLTSFIEALKYADLYLEAKERAETLTTILTSLDTTAADYVSDYNYYKTQIENARTEMDDYKRMAISAASSVTSISSSTQVIAYAPTTSYTSITGEISSQSTTPSNTNISVPTIGTAGAVSLGTGLGSYSSGGGYSSGSGYTGSGYSDYDSDYSSGSSGDSSASVTIPNRPAGENVMDYSALGDDYTVINTSVSVEDYLSTIRSRGICQDIDEDVYGDSCLAFAYIYAYSLYSGKTTAGAKDALSYTYASNFSEYSSNNKQDIMNVIYEDVSNGKPIVLQVNGNTSGTSRHYVTVVGFKKDVDSAANLTEEDLLIIDTWDGELENMDSSSSRFMTTGAACGKDYSGYQVYRLD